MRKDVTLQSDDSAPKTALLLGAGYTARAMMPALRAAGYRVIATNRSGAAVDGAQEVFKFSGAASAGLCAAFERADIILTSIPPARAGGGDPALAALSHLTPRAQWIGYLSATSVYGDRNGQWAFEGEPPTPSLARGRARADAELAWLETLWPVHVFRLAGIYGPGRAPFEKLRAGKARAIIKDGHVINRIHVDDIVSAVMASIAAPNPLAIYNIADGAPCPPQEVLDFASGLIDAPLAKRTALDAPEISDMARSFYAETKLIDISRARRELGWTPQYGGYREGLLAILKAEDPNPEAVYLAGHMDVPQADLAKVKRALPTHIRLSGQEPDCERFRVWQDAALPTRFHVAESFRSPAAFARHQKRMKTSEWALISADAVRDYAVVGA